jgi:hypothetical protein
VKEAGVEETSVECSAGETKVGTDEIGLRAISTPWEFSKTWHLYTGAQIRTTPFFLMTVMDSNVLLSHIAKQVESDVRLLMEQGYIPRAEADSFLSTLNNAGANANGAPVAARAMPTPSPFAKKSTPAMPTAAASTLPQARALWAYNEHSSV